MSEHRLSAIPVVDDAERVIGVMSEADLILRDESLGRRHLLEGRKHRATLAKARASVARDLMTAPAIVIGPEASLAESAACMRTHGVKRLPVWTGAPAPGRGLADGSGPRVPPSGCGDRLGGHRGLTA